MIQDIRRIGPLGMLILIVSLSPASGGESPIPVTVSASYTGEHDPLEALCDGKEPDESFDRSIPRFTFWNHLGGEEWVRYDFDRPREVSSVAVYWYDDRPDGRCRVPDSWVLYYRSGYEWIPIETKNAFPTDRDQYNVVEFKRVRASGLRIQVTQQEGMSSGILEWKINGATPRMNGVASSPEAIPDHLSGLPERWLVLSAWAESGSSVDSQAEASCHALREVIEQVSVKHKPGQKSYRGALRRWAALENAYPTRKVLSQLHRISPKKCLRLMIQLDWLRQDRQAGNADSFQALSRQLIASSDAGLPSHSLAKSRKLLAEEVGAWDPRWKEIYLELCEARRKHRLRKNLSKISRIVFTKHHDIGGQHYAYTEDVSDSPYRDNNPFPHGGELCLLEMDGIYGTVEVLLEEPEGLIRDPDVSYDGERILFARRTSMTEDDYHLYEMRAENGAIRQLTFGKGAADYEGAYLPGGDIVFNSTRCQQIVDCWWSDVSNLYTCDSEGRYLRRLSFDQVHTNYPQVMPDGRVVYTRWDYNDRGQLFPQPLFQMNPDGTGQREFYGNNSWFPTTILHARGIPGTQKVVCVLSGHHTYQKGKLAIIDPRLGRQENDGVQLIAPVRPTEAVRVDKYGYQGEQFQYPYPLSEREFLVTYSPEGSKAGRAPAETPFGIYFMTIDGHRELLVADPEISCNQPVPLRARPEPLRRPEMTDYRQSMGTYYLHDIYQGPGLDGVPRGTVKHLRIVGLEFRAAGIGSNSNHGPAGGALVSTPISVNGAWDVKRVLGTTRVHQDGSACFQVPARTPVYFQALDENHHAVQTMRSWSTLQPGESFACVGCHESQNTTPPTHTRVSLAMKAGPERLHAGGGQARGFSFPRQVQPILDEHCVGCHHRRAVENEESSLSLEGTGELDSKSLKRWSDGYLTLADPKYCRWISPQSPPTMLPPYHAGAVKSPLIELLQKGHEEVRLSPEEMRTIACWIDLGVPYAGKYTETMESDAAEKYHHWLQRRRKWADEDEKNIEAYVDSRNRH